LQNTQVDSVLSADGWRPVRRGQYTRSGFLLRDMPADLVGSMEPANSSAGEVYHLSNNQWLKLLHADFCTRARTRE
jgi:hypothetical protein